jgi:hypothetical protein
MSLTFASGEGLNGEVGWSVDNRASWLDAWTIAANSEIESRKSQNIFTQKTIKSWAEVRVTC